jgi:CBS-domain-containing membrane protein
MSWDARVRDVMPAQVHALPENAPTSYAIALMAFENVSAVPVVTESGELVGLLHALDALRWTAAKLGYVTGTSADITRDEFVDETQASSSA